MSDTEIRARLDAALLNHSKLRDTVLSEMAGHTRSGELSRTDQCASWPAYQEATAELYRAQDALIAWLNRLPGSV